MINAHNLLKTFTTCKSDEDVVNHKKINIFKKTKTKKIEFNAVDDISFHVGTGEILGILGPNGAGKTTLLRMLGGILTPTSGYVQIDDLDSRKDINNFKSKIGYLSGNTKLYGRLTARELMNIFGKLYQMNQNQIDEAIGRISAILKMDDFIDQRIANLSTGQTQRVSIARCLIHSPEIYIFDEPTLGLDVISSRDIISFMKKEKENGKTVLYSTHYLEEAESLCDRILFIHKGKVIAQGTPHEIKENTGTQNLRDAFIKLADIGGDVFEV